MPNRKSPRGAICPEARVATKLAAIATATRLKEVRGRTRGSAPAAFARQAAMYLCHVAFGMSLSQIARAFGRDRSTVSHACHLMEDRREDPEVDSWLTLLETTARQAPLQRLAA